MRILNVKPAIMIFFGLAIASGCGTKPEPAALTKKVDVTGTDASKKIPLPPALWFTTSNFSTGGFLGRLDLKTGDVNHEVLLVESDTQVFQDGSEGLFLLARRFLDSIRILRGVEARVDKYRSLLPPRPNVPPNAQGIARDAKGRIWVTFLETDQVYVYSADLSALVGVVDLSHLKESTEPDAVAELAQIARLDERHMVVNAQRLHRPAQGGWRPEAQSGLAIIDIETLQPVSSGLVNLVNPIEMAVHNGRVMMVGRGDVSPGGTAMGRIAGFAAGSLVMESPEDLPAKVIAADLSVPGEPPAIIAWYPQENKSCVQIGAKTLVCDGSAENGGFVFLAVKRVGDRVFVSYNAAKKAELWILDTSGAAEPKKLTMKMPIQSMSFGP